MCSNTGQVLLKTKHAHRLWYAVFVENVTWNAKFEMVGKVNKANKYLRKYTSFWSKLDSDAQRIWSTEMNEHVL